MGNPLGMAAQLGGNALRFGWYFGVNRMVDRVARRENARGSYTPERPVPTQREILSDLGQLFLQDAQAVRDGLYPPTTIEAVDLPRDIARGGSPPQRLTGYFASLRWSDRRCSPSTRAACEMLPWHSVITRWMCSHSTLASEGTVNSRR